MCSGSLQEGPGLICQVIAFLLFPGLDVRVNAINKLSHIQISEMVPFYIMRYGFYEGHTAFRADPPAIATIFGLKPVSDIDSLFNDELYKVLNQHFFR